MDWKERIAIDPQILVGKPVIKGTRISVELIIEELASGWSYEDILRSYPRLELDDIRACLRYASETLKSQKVFPVRV